jgi:hypothetical protein
MPIRSTIDLHRLIIGASAAILIAVLSAGCAGPTRTADDYRHKAAQTAREVGSALASGRLAAQQLLIGNATKAYADTIISEAEQDARSAQTSFETRQPPDASSRDLMKSVTDPVDQAASLLTDLRIAVRADDHDATDSLQHEVDELLDRIEQLEQLAS